MTILRPPLILAAALMLPAACSSSSPTASPETIAASWCHGNRPGDAACLDAAAEAHRLCITAPGSYDACRARLAGPAPAAR